MKRLLVNNADSGHRPSFNNNTEVIVITSDEEEECVAPKKKKTIVSNTRESQAPTGIIEVDLASEDEQPAPRNYVFKKSNNYVVDRDSVRPRISSSSSSIVSNHNNNNHIVQESITSKQPNRLLPVLSDVESTHDRKTLREIYAQCSDLYKSHKITTENAFSLKLVDCLEEILNSEDFDRKNLHLAARTLEISGKIYVCRVDATHTFTIKLAQEIASNKVGELGDSAIVSNPEASTDNVGTTVQERDRSRGSVKKRSRFIENDESKLNTKFNVQNGKYMRRRQLLKAKLYRLVDEEMEFDYLSFFMKAGDKVHVLEKAETSHFLDTPSNLVTESRTRTDKQISFLPFYMLPCWDPEQHDIWGRELKDIDDDGEGDWQSDEDSFGDSVPIEPEPEPQVQTKFSYDPKTRVDEYPGDDSILENQSIPTNSNADKPLPCGSRSPNSADQSSQLDIDSLQSIKDVQDFFSALPKHQQLGVSNKYGWSGPSFVPLRRPVTKKVVKRRTSKAVTKDKVLSFDEPSKAQKPKFPSHILLGNRDTWSRTVKNHVHHASMDDPEYFDRDADEGFKNEHFDNAFKFEEDQEITRFFITNKSFLKLMEDEMKFNLRSMHNHQDEEEKIRFETIDEDDDDDNDEFMNESRETPDFLFRNDDDNCNDGDGLQTWEQPNSSLQNDISDPYASIASMLPSTALFSGLGTTEYLENPTLNVTDIHDMTHNVTFCKKPKPINMFELKKAILEVLTVHLSLTENGKCSTTKDTETELISVMEATIKKLPTKFLVHFSIPLFAVGLLHVVAENKLFMLPGSNSSGFEGQRIVSRGSAWIHQHNIPNCVNRGGDDNHNML